MTRSIGATTGLPMYRGPTPSIYEAHLRGMTMLRNDIRAEERGTFAALADRQDYPSPARTRYNRDRVDAHSGILAGPHAGRARTVELLGLQHAGVFRRSSRAIFPKNSRNEMRVAVRRLHAAGIEVILDVVYNHTAEGNELGPTLSYPRPRQRQLLSPRPRQQAAIHQRYRHGQHAQPGASACAAAGHGLAALLGKFLPR